MGFAVNNFAAEAVDLRHLDRYTGGDRAVNEEILRLFDQQCAEMLQKLDSIAGQAEGDAARAWREVTHTLKGAARGIGAFSLGEEAAQAEKASPQDSAALQAVARIKAKAEAVTRFIDDFLKNGA
jgi:HPt (histidine-containing phosphotransfer) domain-containing protein